MMNRMNSGSIISSPAPTSASDEDGADRVAMRPQPAQVLAQVLAALAAGSGRRDSALDASLASPGSSSCRRLYFWTNSR